jgi:hypothetical protein
MNLLHVILQIDSIDIAILGDGAVTVNIPHAGGQSLLGVLQVTSFFLNFQETGFALGSTLSISASWLSDNPVEPTFNLIVLDDGGLEGPSQSRKLTSPLASPDWY